MASRNDKQKDIASTGNVDWSVFLQKGVIVSLTIKRYRGVTNIDFSELGIDEDSSDKLKTFLGEYINLGSKRLLPPKIEGKLKSIEQTARQNLKDRSFDCSSFASQGKFVPQAMYKEFKERNDALQVEFLDLRDQLVENYDAMIDKVRKDYKILAENLYMQSHPEASRPSPTYVKAFTEAIVAQIPSSDEIMASFEYETRLSYIPDYLVNVMRKKHNIDEKAMKIASTNPTTRRSNEPEDEIAKDIRQSIETQSYEMAADFVADTQIRLLTFAAEGGEAISSSIERNGGKLIGRASIKAHSLIGDVRGLNYGDTDLSAHIDALERALGEDRESRDVEAVKAAAEELTEWSLKRISEIHDETVSRKVAGKKKGSAPAQPAEEAKPAPRKASQPAPEAKKAPARRKPAPARQVPATPEAKPAAAQHKQTRKPVEEPKPAARQAAPVEEPEVEEPKRKTQGSKKGLTISVPKQAKSRRTVRKRG